MAGGSDFAWLIRRASEDPPFREPLESALYDEKGKRTGVGGVAGRSIQVFSLDGVVQDKASLKSASCRSGSKVEVFSNVGWTGEESSPALSRKADGWASCVASRCSPRSGRRSKLVAPGSSATGCEVDASSLPVSLSGVSSVVRCKRRLLRSDPGAPDLDDATAPVAPE